MAGQQGLGGLVCSGLGRKRRSDLWAYFSYIELEGATECNVIVESETRGGEEAKPAQPREKCGHRIKGKNTTNLKRHLKTFHKEIQIAHVKEPPKKDKPKPTSAGDFFGSSYKLNSPEQQSKEVAVAAWIGRTALPARTVEDEDFIMMMGKIDKRFTVPKKTKVSNLVNEAYVEQQEKFRHRLSVARKVTLGLDIWTKKGLTASFIAISACYFNPEDNKAEHILLNLKEMVHPHTAQAISALVEESIEAWGIPKEKILTTITDNGSNRYDYGTMERTPCVVHTLQLVVNMLLNKEPSIRRLLDKTRHLVNQFRKSSVATERLLQRSALVLIKDCPTRWSSCYSMMARCLQLKDHVTAVAESMGWDSLQPSEWQKIGMLRDLLLPFAEHTKLLQSDTQSLSLVVPALLDLRNHLSEFSLAYARTYRDAASLAQKMLSNMERRFSVFLDVTAAKFSPLAAAACFVDPSVSAETLIENDDEGMQDLLRKAEDYIAHCVPRRVEVRVEQVTDDEEPENVDREAPAETTPAKRPRFKFFSASRPARPKTPMTTNIRQEILKYKGGLSNQAASATNTEVEESGIEFWISQSPMVFPHLKPLALDLLAMPASQAFTERVFSVTGYLSSGRRNRARAILERSAFLKINKSK